MRTYEQYLRDAPPSRRAWAVFALMGAGGLVASLLDVSRMAGGFIAIGAALGLNTFIWLRQNPTLKQIERRERRAADRMNQRSQNGDR